MTPFLTIYVPTARPSVANLLDTLIPQITDGVEVIVSDNTGNAAAACHGQPVTYEPRRYNIGGDANILRAATAGTGEWVWVVGDDDVLLPDAVEVTLQALADLRVDRLIHWDPTAPVDCGGFHGTAAELITRLSPDPSLLVAATLITANVFRRSILDVPYGLRMIDSHYPLMWAAVDARWYRVAPSPVFEVGLDESWEPTNHNLDREWREYLLALAADAGVSSSHVSGPISWNFVSARRGALR